MENILANKAYATVGNNTQMSLDTGADAQTYALPDADAQMSATMGNDVQMSVGTGTDTQVSKDSFLASQVDQVEEADVDDADIDEEIGNDDTDIDDEELKIERSFEIFYVTSHAATKEQMHSSDNHRFAPVLYVGTSKAWCIEYENSNTSVGEQAFRTDLVDAIGQDKAVKLAWIFEWIKGPGTKIFDQLDSEQSYVFTQVLLWSVTQSEYIIVDNEPYADDDHHKDFRKRYPSAHRIKIPYSMQYQAIDSCRKFVEKNLSTNVIVKGIAYGYEDETTLVSDQLKIRVDEPPELVKKDARGWIDLHKHSRNTDITNSHSLYRRDGARYGIYDTESCTSKPVDILSTNEAGYAKSISLNAGTYWVKEISAPKGFALDETIYPVIVKENEVAHVNGGFVVDAPQGAPIDILLAKLDRATGLASAQGGASLAGAHYEVSLYDGIYDEAALPQDSLYTWVFATDKQGVIRFDEAHLISGPGLFFADSRGSPMLPCGTVVVKEIQAPSGYLLPASPPSYIRHITPQGTSEQLASFNAIEDKEDVIRGDLSFTKIEALSNKPFAKIPFLITHTATGESHVVVADDKGVIDTHALRTQTTSEKANANANDALLSKDRTSITNPLKLRDDTPVWFGEDVAHNSAAYDASLGALPYGDYTIQELSVPINATYRLVSFTVSVTENNKIITSGEVKNWPRLIKKDARGWIDLHKHSRDTDITNSHALYHRDGARYGIYDTESCTSEPVDTLNTNEAGYAKSISLNVGTYWVKEISAPKGFALDETIYPVVVKENEVAHVNGGFVVDAPQGAPIDILLAKLDRATGLASAQGGASLAGAHYEVSLYDGIYDEAALPQDSLYTWVFATDKQGVIRFDEAHLISGPGLFFADSRGSPMLPCGTVVVKEIQAPSGYLLPASPPSYIRHITPQGTSEQLASFNAIEDKEDVIRGDLSFTKIEALSNKPFAKIPFLITHTTTGESHVVVTDDKGVIDTHALRTQTTSEKANANANDAFLSKDRTSITNPLKLRDDTPVWFGEDVAHNSAAYDASLGALPYGDYTIQELSVPINATYRLVSFTISITENNKIITSGEVKNWPRLIKKDARGWIDLHKHSRDTDITNSHALYHRDGARYGIYDTESCTSKPVDILSTNEAGYAKSISLNAGTYWVKEISAPKGFALDETIYPVVVKENEVAHVNGGFVVDAPQGAPIDILLAKLDRATGLASAQGGASLAGAHYEVSLYDGIYDEAALPQDSLYTWVFATDKQGVIRFDEAHLISGPGLFFADSRGSPMLPCGTVVVKEIQAPSGYLLPASPPSYIRHITPQGTSEQLASFNAIEDKEDVIRGDLSFTKIEALSNKPFAKIPFLITHTTTGESHVVVTDDKGVIDTHALRTQTTSEKANANANDAFLSKDRTSITNPLKLRDDTPVWFGEDVSHNSAAYDASLGVLPYGDYTIQELSVPINATYRLVSFTISITENNKIITSGEVKNWPRLIKKDARGWIDLHKHSRDTDITNSHALYHRDGACYGIYDTESCTSEPVDTLNTNVAGYAKSISLNVGTYWVKEISAPKGFALDETIYPVVVKENEVAHVNGGFVVDAPQGAPIDILLAKLDRATGLASAQGGASLAGAHYEVSLYDGIYDEAALPQDSLYTWVFATDKQGVIRFDEAHLISGPGLFFADSRGSPMLPCGTVVVKEIQAPSGYLLPASPPSYIRHITPQGTSEQLASFNAIEDKEDVIRGDLSFTKIEALSNKPFAKIPFLITHTTTGESHVVVTDDKGVIDTHALRTQTTSEKANANANDAFLSKDRTSITNPLKLRDDTPVWFGEDVAHNSAAYDASLGALPYGDYTIQELSVPINATYRLVSFTISITENNKIITSGEVKNWPKPKKVKPYDPDSSVPEPPIPNDPYAPEPPIPDDPALDQKTEWSRGQRISRAQAQKGVLAKTGDNLFAYNVGALLVLSAGSLLVGYARRRRQY
jgi:hypothetical protein